MPSIVTAIYNDLLMMIDRLLWQLQGENSKKTEKEYFYTILILIAAAIESALNKYEYIIYEHLNSENISQNRNSKIKKKLPPNKKFAKFFKKETHNEIYDALTEIAIVRDSILHNHLYKNNSSDSYQLLEGYGDKKFKNNVENHKTKRFNLNVIPTKICKEDIATALTIVIEFINFLSSESEKFAGFNNIISSEKTGLKLDKSFEKWIEENKLQFHLFSSNPK